MSDFDRSRHGHGGDFATSSTTHIAPGKRTLTSAIQCKRITPTIGAVVQRKKDATAVIDWPQATGGRPLSDGSNANLVFLVEFPEGPVVVKVYKSGGPGKEVGGAKMAGALQIPGVVAPGMRQVDGGEREACLRKLDEIAGEAVPRLPVAVMDNMPGQDLKDEQRGTEQDPLDPRQQDGRTRIGNTGGMFAFNMLVDGRDRFDDPQGMGNGSGNNNNLRFASGGTDLQAIDTTLPDSTATGFRMGGVDDELGRRIKQITNFIDDAILNQDSAIAITVAKQLGLDVTDPQVMGPLQQGFVEGVEAIGGANVDFAQLLQGLNSSLFTEQGKDQQGPAYARYMQGLQAHFAKKAQFARAVRGTDDLDLLRSEGLELVRQANGIAVGRPVASLALARKHAKTSDGKHGTWPGELTALRAGKDRIDKSTTAKQLADVIALIAPAFTAISSPKVKDKTVEDFDRLVAKIILRADKHDLIPEDQPIQKSARDGAAESHGTPAARGSGAAMPGDVQAKMEHAFNADFSAVRVHEGAGADAMGARAYAQGTDVHFAPGEYRPGSADGQALLGHELAHVVQQAEGRVSAAPQASGAAINKDPALEHEADVLGARAAAGEVVRGGDSAAVMQASTGPIQKDEKSSVGEFIPWLQSQEVYKRFSGLGAKQALGQCGPAAKAIGPFLAEAGFEIVYRGMVAFNLLYRERSGTVVPNNGNHYVLLVKVAGETVVVDVTQRQFQGGSPQIATEGEWLSRMLGVTVFSIGRGAPEYVPLPLKYEDFGSVGAAIEYGGQTGASYDDVGGTALGPGPEMLEELYSSLGNDNSHGEDTSHGDDSSGGDGMTTKPKKGGGKGKGRQCFLTTACVEALGLADDCTELRVLRGFRDGYMAAQPDGPTLITEYYRIAPPIVVAMAAAAPHQPDLYRDLYERLVRRSVALIQSGRDADALAHYRAIVLELERTYLRPGA